MFRERGREIMKTLLNKTHTYTLKHTLQMRWRPPFIVHTSCPNGLGSWALFMDWIGLRLHCI